MIQQPSNKTMMLFSGSSNRSLSEEVAKKLGTNLIPIESKKFASGEIYIRLNESASCKLHQCSTNSLSDADDEKVHETWQGRGLSRGELRRHVMKLMEWEEFPESSPTEILNQIKEKVTA